MLAGLAPSCNQVTSAPIETMTYRIVHTYDHDPEAFTQGLFYADGFLYESTGLYGHSSLRKVALESGAVLSSHLLADHYFAEGITLWDDQIIQLTWRAQVAFVYAKETFKQLRRFSYPTEGWGITHDGSRLIMSDGSAILRFLDPDTFEQVESIEVHEEAKSISLLNELEYINGEIFANIWQSDRIVRINPDTGAVTGWIDLEGLLKSVGGSESADVLNGIAYDAARDRLFVTGKLWPKLFEIELIPQTYSSKEAPSP